MVFTPFTSNSRREIDGKCGQFVDRRGHFGAVEHRGIVLHGHGLLLDDDAEIGQGQLRIGLQRSDAGVELEGRAVQDGPAPDDDARIVRTRWL